MIDQDYHARLADFGLATISDSTTANSCDGTYRWMSPELHKTGTSDPPTRRRTESSDCYALGMVVYEVLSESVPFSGCTDPVAVIKVLAGERPGRPDGRWFTNEIWTILEHCWKAEPGDRPSVNCVLQCLEEASVSWAPPLSSITEIPREASSLWSQSDLVIGGGTGVTHSSQPGESTWDHCSVPV